MNFSGIAGKRTLKAKAAHRTNSAQIITGEDLSESMWMVPDKLTE